MASKKQGEAGAEALKKHHNEKIKKNKKALVNALRYFKDNNLPITKKQLEEISKLSKATLNRSPYKEIINDYMEVEGLLLLKENKDISILIKENETLKNEINRWKEKYERLKNEIHYCNELYN